MNRIDRKALTVSSVKTGTLFSTVLLSVWGMRGKSPPVVLPILQYLVSATRWRCCTTKYEAVLGLYTVYLECWGEMDPAVLEQQFLKM